MNLYALFLFFVGTIAFSGYTSDENIYELTPSNFDKVVHKSNYTTIVKFYAPWCGYCRQLEPVYHKLGKYIHKDAKHAIHVAAVNCDLDQNKPLCARHQISSFPTLKVFRPSKFALGQHTYGTAASETYHGERKLKSIWNFLKGKIKNYVKKYNNLGKGLQNWLAEETPNDSRRKAVVITKSRDISPMLKSLAIDFLNSWRFCQAVVGKNDGLPDFEAAGHKLPVDENDTYPLFYAWKEEGGWEKYTGKTSDPIAISKWLVEKGGVYPSEGPLSKREKKYYSKYRTGKSKIEHDEL